MILNRTFIHKKKMFKQATTSDKLFLAAAILSLLYSETLFFSGEKQDATFVGLWVPSILAFAIFFKLINQSKND
jgi:hypothetical protein